MLRLSDITKLPNLLTLLRLFLCFPIIYNLVYKQNYIYAALIVGLAALTDIIDGLIARKLNMVTGLGELLDPVVDKIFVLVLMIAFVINETIPLLWLIILAAKEIIQLFGGLMMLKYKNMSIPARPFGKAATVLLLSGVIALLVFPSLPLGLYLLAFGIFLSLVAGLDYLLLSYRSKSVY